MYRKKASQLLTMREEFCLSLQFKSSHADSFWNGFLSPRHKRWSNEHHFSCTRTDRPITAGHIIFGTKSGNRKPFTHPNSLLSSWSYLILANHPATVDYQNIITATAAGSDPGSTFHIVPVLPFEKIVKIIPNNSNK